MKHFVINATNVDPPITNTDAELIFGPLEENEEIIFSNHIDLESLAIEAGIFSSKGQSRKNGLYGPVPHGIFWFGTKKIIKRFWVWNPLISNKDPVYNKSFDKTDQWFK